jgi:hypothetical protein
VDLGEAGVGEERTALVCAPGGSDVAGLGIGREVEDVAVAARAQHDRVTRVALVGARHQVAAQDSARHAIHHDHVEHLVTRVQLHPAICDLAHHRAVGAEQELLSRLTSSVERATDLCASEGAVGQDTAVLAREGHAERHAVIDDVVRDLGQSVDVRLTRAEVPALDGVVEQTLDAVAVVGIVLRRIDPALGGDRVGAARAVLDAEDAHAVAELPQGRCGRRAGQARADDEHVEPALVGGVHELQLEAMLVPALLDGTRGTTGVQGRGAHRPAALAPEEEEVDRNRGEADGEHHGQELAEPLEQRIPRGVVHAQRLQRAAEAVREVHAYHERRDDVHGRVPGLAERLLHKRGGPLEEARVEAEVQQVLDQVTEDQRARVEHRDRTERARAARAAHDVARSPRLDVLEREPERQVHVSQEQEREADLRHDQQRPEALQEVHVGVEALAALVLEQLQVPVQVLDQEAHEEQPGEPHDDLLPDRRGQRVAERSHGREEVLRRGGGPSLGRLRAGEASALP